MDFAEAKRQLEYEDRERHRQWRAESICRIAEGKGSMIDELFLKEYKDPWYQRAFYKTHNFLRDLFRGYVFGTVKSRWQRMRRGYGYQDIWSLDSYLEDWMPEALRELAKKTHGHPWKVYDHDGSLLYEIGFCCDEVEDEPDEEGCVDTHHAIWQDTLCRMADGFAAKRVLHELEWHGKSEAEKELKRIAREGLQLFTKNFDALWD